MHFIKIKSNYKLSKLTSFKIGGNAEYYCEPESIDELIELFNFAKYNNLNLTIIGGGTNLLISDNGIKGLAISSKKLNKITVDKNIVIAESGVKISDLNKSALKNNLTGVEFSNGLPGFIGGAVYMNARAYGRQFSEIIEEITALTFSGQIKKFNKKDLDYSYKKSIFMKNDDLFIYKIKLKLKQGDYKEIKKDMLKNYIDRKNKKQYLYPSAGCVFKNNYDKNIIAGKVIDELGLKGLKIGGAEIADYHGNFFINKKNAKAEDVKKLIELVEKKVLVKKKVKLEREIKLIGF